MRHLRAIYIGLAWLLATYLLVSVIWLPAAWPTAFTVMVLALLFELRLDAITEGQVKDSVWGCLLFGWLVVATLGLALWVGRLLSEVLIN